MPANDLPSDPVPANTHARSEQQGIDHRARAILESITDAFFSLGRDWKFIYANPQSGRILGRDPAGLIGKSIWVEYPGLVGSVFEPIYRGAMDGGVAGTMTSFYPDHDRYYEVRTYPAPDGISIYFRDVSEQVRADEALRTSEQQRRLALEAAELGSWHVDPATMRLQTDARFRAIFGITAESISYEDAVALIHVDDRGRVNDAVLASTREENPVPYAVEYRVVHPDGSIRWVFARGRANNTQVENEQKLGSFDGIVADITDRKIAEAERQDLLDSERAARSLAEHASRMKDEFLATLSHELRTPLSAIIGWAHIMTTADATPEDIISGAEVIQRNARAQAQIIDDLLDMSRIISGKVRLDVQRLDLASIVQSSVDTARPTAEAKGVRLQSVIDPLQKDLVTGDSNRIQQVLWNLLSNAIKFTPKGGVVQVLLERVNSHLEISVIDSGEGIAAEFLPYVFDRFRQADGSTTRKHGGLGLGLAIVKQLVELHGGSVRVKSGGRGMGTTFAVTLPLLVVRAEQGQAQPSARRHARVSSDLTANPMTSIELEGVRVLVVDDEPDSRILLKRVLEECHAIVTTAGSSKEAFRAHEKSRFDVIISDIGMPDEDGYALIKRIRALGKDRGGDVPAIALTAYARSEDRVKAIAAGYMMHVVKPVEPVELLTLVAAAAGWPGGSSAKAK